MKELIFRAIGQPVKEEWPGLLNLPGWKNIAPKVKGWKPLLRNLFRHFNPLALDLLEKLLASPSRRISAQEALKHKFFESEPVACDPSEYAVGVYAPWFSFTHIPHQ